MTRLFMMLRMTLGLVLLGSLALASGCDSGSSTPVTAPPDAKAQGESMQNAMEKQFGPGGPATGKKPTR